MKRNVKLFPLLAHVAAARATGRTFAAAAGLDHLDAAATLDGYRHLAERIGFAPSRAAVPA